ncbi:MAG: hypothetical protein ABI365_05390 [Lysobacteraceae bacterium]
MPIRFATVLWLAMLPATALAAATLTGWMTNPALDEVSGMAASHAHPGVLWVENDSDNPADVYAVSPGGSLLATLHIDGVPNIDWEDFAAFDFDGHHYLIVADAGDNGGIRKTLALHVFEEPKELRDAHVKPAWSIAFRWPDGPRDCEAVAVDVRTSSILLITKKRVPAQLFRLPLRPSESGVLTAELLGTLNGIPQPTADEIAAAPHYAKYLSQITAVDIAPDRSSIAVLTYRRAYLYRRAASEDWAQAVAHVPIQLSFGWLPQAEALAFARDGRSVYVSGEHLPAPIMQVDIPASH